MIREMHDEQRIKDIARIFVSNCGEKYKLDWETADRIAACVAPGRYTKDEFIEEMEFHVKIVMGRIRL